MGIWKFVQRQRDHARGNYWFRLSGKAARGIAVGKNGHPYAIDNEGNSMWPDKACESGQKNIWYFTSKVALTWEGAKNYCQ